MSSIRKFTILLSEDGRGKEVSKTIGGLVIDAYDKYKNNFIAKVLSRFEDNKFLTNELINNIEYEKNINFNRLNGSFLNIDNNFNIMKKFIKQLP